MPTSDIFGAEPSLDLNIKEQHITLGDINKDNKGKEPTDFTLDMLRHYKKGDTNLGDIRQRLENKSTGFQTYIVTNKDVCNTLRAGSNDFIQIDENNKKFIRL